MNDSTLSRRCFLTGTLASASVILLAACTPPTPQPAPEKPAEPVGEVAAPVAEAAPAAETAADPAEALANGQGAVLEIGGEEVAVYKDDDGEVTKLSPLCPHRGCVVQWNESEGVWDCPCHASRFAADGALVRGPATQGLKKVEG